MKKKIEAALKIGQPQKVRNILRRSYVLSNIIAPTVVWTERHTKLFRENNLISRCCAMSTYSDLNLPTIQETIN